MGIFFCKPNREIDLEEEHFYTQTTQVVETSFTFHNPMTPPAINLLTPGEPRLTAYHHIPLTPPAINLLTPGEPRLTVGAEEGEYDIFV